MTRCRRSVRSTWTGSDSAIRRTWDVLCVFWSRVNMPATPDMVGTVLCRVPRILCQRLHRYLHALGGMVTSRDMILTLRSYGSVKTCWTVLISQPSSTFCVLQAASLCGVSSVILDPQAQLSSVLGRNSLSMARNSFRIICCISVGLPCNIPMNSPR